MVDYQPFSISNFRTGFNEALEPWLLPRDAFQVMVNAHLYRGVLEKIGGYTLFSVMSYKSVVAVSPNGTNTYTGVPTQLTFLPSSQNFLIYGTIIPGATGETMTYSMDGPGANEITLSGDNGGSAVINIVTGAVTITFGAAVPINTYSSITMIYDRVANIETAIMGIKQYYFANGGQSVLVFDQRNVGILEPITSTVIMNQYQLNYVITRLTPDYWIDTVFTGDGATLVFTTGVNATPLHFSILPGTIAITAYNGTTNIPTGLVITDNGMGALSGTNVTGSVNYSNGNYTLTFTAGNAPALGVYFTAVMGVPNIAQFTGSISNFFSLTNYLYNAFFVNNIDPICYYNGDGRVHYLDTNFTTKKILAVNGVPTFDISTCLHVFTLRERLLAISPTVSGVNQQSSVWWSVAENPMDWTNDDHDTADTSQPMRAIGYINTDLVIRFSNSEAVFRWTNDENSPFRFDNTNNMWPCDASYSAISYDKWFSSVGKPAIVGSDAVNVKRVDEIIPDFTDPYPLVNQTPIPYMSQTSIQQCYGERFDDIKEGWLCYNSSPVSESVVTASDKVLSFNYLDNTYAIYDFPFSCLGFGRLTYVPTWGTTFTKWGDYNDPWGSYKNSGLNSLIDLAGDQFNRVYQLNDGNTKGDSSTPILMSVITKNFNPFIEQGELCRFGYVDIFVTANATATLRVQFFLNDELYIDSNGDPAGYYQESILTFTPTDAMSPVNTQVKVWKRIYVGAVGKEHTIRFYQKSGDFTVTAVDQPIYIHAFVLYMKPAGRIFN